MSPILEMRGITKTFPGVKALDNVNLIVNPGEIHAICGENGAGKSTLMKVLSGVYPHGSYTGDILYEGQTVSFRDISESEHLGIIIIHQELALVPLLSIAENMFLGNETSRFGIIDWDRAFARTRELLALVGLDENPETLITNLGVGKQQLVEIAKALAKKVKLLILDEPTASLNESDSQKLLDLLLDLQGAGHELHHHLAQAERDLPRRRFRSPSSATAPRSRRSTATRRTISEDRIIKGMVGRDMESRYPQPDAEDRRPAARGPQLDAHHHVHADRAVCRNINLTVRRGEIVGIAGLMGAGPHRARHERLRPLLRAEHLGRGAARRQGGGRLDHRPGHRRRHRLRDRGPQAARPRARREHHQEHDAGQPAGRVQGHR